MRLIDADVLKSELYKLGMFEDVAEMVNTTINCMPTAYDPDKVFEEIELRKGISQRNIKLNSREENLNREIQESDSRWDGIARMVKSGFNVS
jgi:hypothetical protein|nr:MAG TPA: hypothetical protein [Caudoviricetes sp.]